MFWNREGSCFILGVRSGRRGGLHQDIFGWMIPVRMSCAYAVCLLTLTVVSEEASRCATDPAVNPPPSLPPFLNPILL